MPNLHIAPFFLDVCWARHPSKPFVARRGSRALALDFQGEIHIQPRWRQNLSFYWQLLGAVIFLLFCFKVSDNFREVYFYSFMRRDLHRALGILRGELIFFGPETTGGGYLPGPLFYFLLAIPLAIAPVWQSAFLFLNGIYLSMAISGWIWLRRHVNLVSAFLFIGLLALSHPVRSFVLLFLNLSYMIPFAFFGLISACVAYAHPDEKIRRCAFLVAVTLTAAGIQFHYSILCLLWGMLFLHVFANRLSLYRPAHREWFKAAAIFLVLLLPFWLWRGLGALGVSFGQPGSFVGSAPGSIKTLLMMVQFSSQVPWQILVREAGLRFLAATPVSLAIVLLVFAGFYLWDRLRGQRGPWPEVSADETRAFRALVWMAVWAFVPFSYVFLVHMGRRYGMVYCFSLILITLVLLTRALQVRRLALTISVVSILVTASATYLYFNLDPLAAKHLLSRVVLALMPLPFVYFYVRQRYHHAFAVMLCLSTSLFVAILQYHLVTPRGLREKLVPRLHRQDYVKIWTHVISNTGWDYGTAMRRTYFVNLRLDEDPGFVFDDLKESLGEVSPAANPPDGYIVLNAKVLKRDRGDESYREYLLRQRIPPEIRQALQDGTIDIQKSYFRGVRLFPYRVRHRDAIPINFHSQGEGYRRSRGSKRLDELEGAEAIKQVAVNKWMFKWNECTDLNPFCNTGAEVELQHIGPHYRAVVDVMGSAISQNSPWVSPSFTQAWLQPYLEIHCGSEVRRHLLFSSIGLLRAYGSNEYNEILQANNSVVAPFHREIRFDCASGVKAVGVGREGSQVEQLVRSVALPGKRLLVELQAKKSVSQ